jgi:hypothetical protein
MGGPLRLADGGKGSQIKGCSWRADVLARQLCPGFGSERLTPLLLGVSALSGDCLLLFLLLDELPLRRLRYNHLVRLPD